MFMEALSNVCDEHLPAARKLKPGTVVPPMAACNYATTGRKSTQASEKENQ